MATPSGNGGEVRDARYISTPLAPPFAQNPICGARLPRVTPAGPPRAERSPRPPPRAQGEHKTVLVDTSKRESHHLGSGFRKFMRKLRPFADVESCVCGRPPRRAPCPAQRLTRGASFGGGRRRWGRRRLKEQVISTERLEGASMLVMGNPRAKMTDTEVRSVHPAVQSRRRRAQAAAVAAAADSPLSRPQLDSIDAFVKGGGSLLVTLSEGDEREGNVDELCRRFGVAPASDAVVRTVYYKYLHPKEVFIGDGVVNKGIAAAARQRARRARAGKKAATAAAEEDASQPCVSRPCLPTRALLPRLLIPPRSRCVQGGVCVPARLHAGSHGPGGDSRSHQRLHRVPPEPAGVHADAARQGPRVRARLQRHAGRRVGGEGEESEAGLGARALVLAGPGSRSGHCGRARSRRARPGACARRGLDGGPAAVVPAGLGGLAAGLCGNVRHAPVSIPHLPRSRGHGPVPGALLLLPLPCLCEERPRAHPAVHRNWMSSTSG